MKLAVKIASPITFTVKDLVWLEDIGLLVNQLVFTNTQIVNYYVTDFYNENNSFRFYIALIRILSNNKFFSL